MAIGLDELAAFDKPAVTGQQLLAAERILHLVVATPRTQRRADSGRAAIAALLLLHCGDMASGYNHPA